MQHACSAGVNLVKVMALMSGIRVVRRGILRCGEQWVSFPSSDGSDVHLLHMEGLGFSIHSCNMAGKVDMERIIVVICWSRKVINEGGFICSSSLSGEILKVGDKLLESIIEGTVLLLEELLNKFSEVGVRDRRWSQSFQQIYQRSFP